MSINIQMVDQAVLEEAERPLVTPSSELSDSIVTVDPAEHVEVEPEKVEKVEATRPLLKPSADFQHCDDFEKFEKHWNSSLNSALNSLFHKATTIFDSHDGEPSEFIKILESSHSGSFRFVSFVLQHFKAWNDKDVLEKCGSRAFENFGSFSNFQGSPQNGNQLEPNGKVTFTAKPSLENLFSYLMYDWFDPEPGQTYAMKLKSDQFQKTHKKSVFKVLFDIIDDQRYKLYRQVVLRLLYQYLYEMEKKSNLKKEEIFACIEQLKVLVLGVKDQELKVSGLKIVGVFWLIGCTDDEKFTSFEKATKTCLENDQTALGDSLVNKNVSEQRQTEELMRITKETSKFLELCFLLKHTDKSLLKFQEAFEEYLKSSEKYYGDYTHIEIIHNIKLLSFLAEHETLYTTFNYIAGKFPDIRITTILTIFENAQVATSFKVHKFKSAQLEKLFQLSKSSEKGLNEKLKSSVEKLESLIESSTDLVPTFSVRDLNCLLFGRTLNTEVEVQEDSLFEKILKTPGSGDLIKLIWSNTDASTRSTLSGLKNCNGKYLLEYAIESGDDKNLLEFLTPTIEEMSLTVPKVSLKFLNRQYKIIEGKSILDHVVDVCDVKKPEDKSMMNWIFESSSGENPLCSEFYTIVLSFLEDCRLIEEIEHDVPIDNLLDWANIPQSQNVSVFGITILTIEKARENEKYKHIREEIDVLLGSIVAFWSKTDTKYSFYKDKLLEGGQFRSFFVVLFSIIEKDALDEFSLKFVENFDRVEDVFVERYGRELEDVRPRRYFFWLIILTAILNDRKDVVEYVLKIKRVKNLKLYFPSNMRQNDTTNFFAMQMLENGYEIGRRDFPLHWVTPEQFKEFLDSRMKYVKRDLIEVDCRFLTHFHSPEHTTDSKVVAKWEDTKCLEYILEDLSLKDFITHPTIATYIDLKMHRFRSIYWGNFWFFALLIALPFGVLVTSYFSHCDPQTIIAISTICSCSIAILISREFFQYRVIEDSFHGYIKQPSNILEVCLILVATATLAVILLGDYMREHLENYFGSYMMLMKLLSVTLMLLFTADLLVTLQNAAMPFYFILFRRVAATFLKFLGTFLVFLLAFTISFVVFFGDDSDMTKNTASIDDLIATGTDPGNDEDRDEVFFNFVTFPKAFMKIILMLSGEYSIEPFKLSAAELALFFIFVITTFILFNLILGLTIDDVHSLKKDARAVILKLNAGSIIETSSFFLKVLDKAKASEQRHLGSFRCVQCFINLMVSRAEARATKYLLHKNNKYYINIRTREVTLGNGKQREGSRSWFNKVVDFFSGLFVNHTFDMKPDDFEECMNVMHPAKKE